jgi:hypothetical protein
MGSWWNDADEGKPTFSEKNMPQFHFVYHKFHVDWLGIEPGPPVRCR